MSPNSQIKLAFFSTVNLEFGGGLEKFFVETANALARQPGIEVSIICPSDRLIRLFSAPQALLRFKLPQGVTYAETTESLERRLGSARYLRADSINDLRRKLTEFNVIYSRNELAEALVFKLLLGYKGLPPIIFGSHTSMVYEYPMAGVERIHNFVYNIWPYPWLARNVSAFHVLNASSQATLTKLFPAARVQKIRPSLMLKPVHSYKIRQSPATVIWVGRLSRVKGVSDLCHLIDSLNEKRPHDVRWVICGDGDGRPQVEAAARRWDNVEYLGYLPNAQIAERLAQASVFLSTSRVETFGYSAAEALVCRLPVVGYSVAGLREIVRQGENGMLVSTLGDLEKLLTRVVDGSVTFKAGVTHAAELTNDENYSSLASLIEQVSGS